MWLAVLLVAAMAAAVCSWTDGASGARFDLERLAQMGSASSVGEGNVVYTLRPCGVSTQGPCGHSGGALNKAEGDTCLDTMAYWRSPGMTLLDEKDPHKGFRLALMHEQRKTIIDFLCDVTTDAAFTVVEEDTATRVQYTTKYACPVNPESIKRPSSALTVGLLLFLAILAYISISFTFKSKLQERGLDWDSITAAFAPSRPNARDYPGL